MTLLKNAKRALGELFIMGFNGLELSGETSAFIKEAGIGGVLLFAKNYENPAQVTELNLQIQECRGEFPLWISVDQEGGKVQRFKKGFTRIPEAALIGAMNSPKLAFDIADVMAKELRAVGVNLNFCPVADINTNPKNPVIGQRAFGSTEEAVSKMVTGIVRGHLTNGVQPCVKHFPGHGDTHSDSHFTLPKVNTALDILQEREFQPFIKAFKSKCSMVMTAHIVNPLLDPSVPATLSSTILKDLLRKQLRYEKLIISDDLEMKAITDHYGAEDAPRLALEAGCDLLIYRTEEAAFRAYEALQRALEGGKLGAQTVLDAHARSQNLKKEVLAEYHPVLVSDVGKTVGIPEHLAVMRNVDGFTTEL